MSYLSEGVAVITGAGSGMGRCLAQQLAAMGASLALADVNEQGLAETAALLGRARLFVFLGCVLALVRYRSAVPLLFLVLVLDDVTIRLTHLLEPIPRTGSAPGVTINLVLAALMVVGLVLSLWPRRTQLVA